jgi:hypothetical protein
VLHGVSCFNVTVSNEYRYLSRETFPVPIMIDKQRLENVECFNCLGSTITHCARCTCEIKYSHGTSCIQ